jgi:hypothetical protein
MRKVDEHEDTWFVELDGKESELNQLKLFLAQYSDCEIILKEDINKYYLTGSRLETIPADAIRKKAEKIIQRLKGLAEVKGFGTFHSVEIGERIIGKNTWNMLSNAGTVNVGATTVNLKINGQASSTIVTQHQGKLGDLINEKNKLDALDYIAKEKKWVNLNKAYETVKLAIDWNMDVKGSKIVKNRWATEKELRDFTHTAHTIDSASGTEGEGRHSKLYVKWYQAQQKTKKQTTAKKSQKQRCPPSLIDLDEGKERIKRLLDKWIK